MRAFAILPLLLTACAIDRAEPDPPGNQAPRITHAEAGCYWDAMNADWIVWFEAHVADSDGALDVFAVQVDVRDAWADEVVDSFELYPTGDVDEWFSDWLASSTWLDCQYDGYNADFWAYDQAEASGSATVVVAVD